MVDAAEQEEVIHAPFVASNKLAYDSIADRILDQPAENYRNQGILYRRANGFNEQEIDEFIRWCEAKAPSQLEPDPWDSAAARKYKREALDYYLQKSGLGLYHFIEVHHDDALPGSTEAEYFARVLSARRTPGAAPV